MQINRKTKQVLSPLSKALLLGLAACNSASLRAQSSTPTDPISEAPSVADDLDAIVVFA
jgi:hypothetical protein